jgi:hypothetical protein
MTAAEKLHKFGKDGRSIALSIRYSGAPESRSISRIPIRRQSQSLFSPIGKSKGFRILAAGLKNG